MAYDTKTLLAEIDSILQSKPHVSLVALTKRLTVERHTIEKAIRDQRKVSFRQYRTEKMLEKTFRIMSERRGSSIKQIAVALDFTTAATFTRFVKRASGMTPTDLRRKTGG
jgi:AraC-like DNA-binding protein